MKNYMIFVLLIISVVIFCAGAEECIDPRMEIILTEWEWITKISN